MPPLVVASCSTASQQPSPSNSGNPLIRADAEVFAAVVEDLKAKRQSAKEKVDTVWFDARPFGEPTIFHDVAGGGTGMGDSTLFRLPDTAVFQAITRSRREILSRMLIGEGRAFSYPKCGGMLRPPEPPQPGTIQPAAGHPSDCPPRSQQYLNVGFPVRGVPEKLKKAPPPKGKSVDWTGDLWTVVVNIHGVGPSGQGWFQYAYVLKRNPGSRSLELLTTILLSWAE